MATEAKIDAAKLYVEVGSDYGANGAASVWCVMDGNTHEQLGEAFETQEDAEAAIALAQMVAA